MKLSARARFVQRKHAQYALLTLFIVGLVISLITLDYAERQELLFPATTSSLNGKVWELYGPTLALIVGGLFGNGSSNTRVRTSWFVIAILLVLIWNWLVVGQPIAFLQAPDMHNDAVITSSFEGIGRYGSYLLDAVLAYFFTSNPDQPASPQSETE